MADYDMLSTLGVDVPCKVMRLTKPVSAFIEEGGGALATWQRDKQQQQQHQAAGMPSLRREERSVGRRIVQRSSSCSLTPSSRGSLGMESSEPSGSMQRREWRAHAHPMQRSHFSALNPSGLVLGSEVSPLPHTAPAIHHKVGRRPPVEDTAPHPLEDHQYANAHASKRLRQPLHQMPVNTAAAAGAPSGKITRAPIPSDVDSIHQDSTAPVHTRPPARVAGPKIWTEERSRKEHEREHRAYAEAAAAARQQQQQESQAMREKVLSATSPAREAAGGGRLWTAERQKREDQATSRHARPLNHMHKKLWDPEPQCSPQRPGQVGVQKSSLQQHWQQQGWWSDQAPEPVQTKLQYVPPTSPQPAFAIPSFSKNHFEVSQQHHQQQQGSGAGRRRSLSPAVTRSSSRPASFRQWKP